MCVSICQKTLSLGKNCRFHINKDCLPYTVGAGLVGADSESVAVLEGDSVTLVCGTDLTGNPIPTVVWRDNNGRSVEEGGRDGGRRE